MRYADPALCPDCRSSLPAGADRCGTCDLVVRHRIAVDLFRTLTRADDLLADLRVASAAATPAPVPVPASAGATAGAGSGAWVPPPPPATGAVGGPTASSRPPVVPPPPVRTHSTGSTSPGLSTTSIPKILLGLGALCLLVAAVVFLAVSWTHLGVGGRTAVLVGLTLAAAGSALGLLRADLRVAAESLSVVALGLLALDVLGSAGAGWFGEPGPGVATAATGAVVALGAAGLGALRLPGRDRLVAPQIIVGVAGLVGYAGLLEASDHAWLVGHLMIAVGLIPVGLAIGLRTDGAPTTRPAVPALVCSVSLAVALIWIITALDSLGDALADPSVVHLWQAGSGWSLLVCAAWLLVPGALLQRLDVTVVAGAGAALIVTTVLALPALDAGAGIFGLTSLLVTMIWTAVLAGFGAVLPKWRAVPATPALVGATLLAGQWAVAVVGAIARWAHRLSASDVAFDQPAGIVLRRPDPWVEPAILVPAALTIVAVVTLLIAPQHRRPAVVATVAGSAGGFAGVTTLASYDVALAWVLVALLLVAGAAALIATRTSGIRATAMAGIAGVAAAAAGIGSLPSDVLATGAGAGALGIALLLLFAATGGARILGSVLATPSILLLTAAAVSLAADGSAVWFAMTSLVSLGVLGIARPRTEVEVPAILGAWVALPIALEATPDPAPLLVLWLTVAGALCCASALLHDERRFAGLIAPACWLAASWVWLADHRITAPEAYTLPVAVALVGLGLARMRRDAAAGSLGSLTPGLLLATLPSLLWTLDDPASLRALLLGIGCLAATVAGASLRWAAPLAVGAGVGAILTLRVVAPFASEVPQWVWIGAAGVLLTVLGITWERRLRDLRRTAGLVGRLR